MTEELPNVNDCVANAVAELGYNLSGLSVVDLVMDNFPNLSVADAKCALIMSSVDDILSPEQVARYSE